jgi:hypothetical protein
MEGRRKFRKPPITAIAVRVRPLANSLVNLSCQRTDTDFYEIARVAGPGCSVPGFDDIDRVMAQARDLRRSGSAPYVRDCS